MLRKKAGFTFLFIASTILFIILVLFSLYMHLAVVSSKFDVPEARILPQVYLATVSIFIFLVLSIWSFSRKRVREIFKSAR